ncbi:MAG: SUMF1/EgtB/PvdO family nonheme iron enzyme [Candidatus Promineofilum sp.]|nr:SUMF1/EgtB/PvdO family nonheme iron enzyme [Promineifilum sp.]
MDSEQERQIIKLTQARDAGLLDESTYQAAVAGIRTGAYQVEADGGSVISQGSGTTAVGAGGVNVSGTVYGSIYTGEPTDDASEALRIYRQVLLTGSAHLPLRGVDVGAGDPAMARQLGLANVYVGLDTTTFIDGDVEVSQDEMDELNRRRFPLSGRQELFSLTALKAVAENRWVVLTGEPGGGKSTFVNHLAYCLASQALFPAAGWLGHLPGWPEAEGMVLPVPVALRDFAATVDASRNRPAAPGDLWRFITARLEEQNLDFAARAIEGELQQGRAIILLDGLDEVTREGQRAIVRDAVAVFAGRYPGNRFLVTCRALGYQPPDQGKVDLRLDAAQFPVYELALFDEKKIDRFIDAWYAELSRLGSVRDQDAGEMVSRLKTAVRRPDLWRMARNPLLLTVIALVHAYRGWLPDTRALLYDETVDMLLWRWEEIKARAPTLRQLLQDAGRAELDLKRALWRLAFEAHGQSGEGTEALGAIAESQLTRALIRLKPEDWQWAHEMVAAMKLRAGLLLERSPGVFTFPHRTFQEYMAGAHLSTQSDCARQAAELGTQGVLWREVILLAAGRLVHVAGDVDRALALVNRLCPERAQEDETGWRNAWLAGEALREIGVQRARDDEWGQELLARVGRRLAGLVARGPLGPRERAAVGEVLADLGDPRPGVGVRAVGDGHIPDFELYFVPAGPFWMGSLEEEGSEDERPLHWVYIPYGYWIGQYPVTVEQWRSFCAAAAYTPQRTVSREGIANAPAVWITWYDAIAYCRWLTKAGQTGRWLPADWVVALPSEAEWEKAARGGVGLPEKLNVARLGEPLSQLNKGKLVVNPWPKRHFPWGDEPADPKRANYRETGLGHVCTVGIFTAGVGPYGAMDLSGNVWEWTRSLYKAYKYDAADGRERVDNATADDRVVLRGGAYWNDAQDLRCASRNGSSTHDVGDTIGFRIVVSHLSHLWTMRAPISDTLIVARGADRDEH